MANGFDYSGLTVPEYQPPQYDFGAVGGFPSFDMPSFDVSTPAAPGLTGFDPTLQADFPTLPQGPQAPTPQPGMLDQFLGRQSSGLEKLLLLAGLLPLGMGAIGAFQGIGRGEPGSTGQQVQTRTAAPAGGAEQLATLNALLGSFSPFLNPGMVEQAFQPQLGNLTEHAIEQARQAGFHTNPLESPVAERIMSQGLADLQGQIAAAKLQQQQFGSQLGLNLTNVLQGGRLGQGTTSTTSNALTSGGTPPLFTSGLQLAELLGRLGGALGSTRPAAGGTSLSGLPGAPRLS